MEAPTLLLWTIVYGGWLAVTAHAGTLGPGASVIVLGFLLALHSSLQHEAMHGHPTPWPRVNDALASPPLGLLIPYERFREQHLAHHHDPSLTDPYDDPESNYLAPSVWAALPRPVRLVLAVNNTLLGRMVVGPVIGLAALYRGDLALVRAGDRMVLRAWGLHAAWLAPVLMWLALAGTMSAAWYVAACWLALAILRIRTFLEHQAHARAAARSVIIEDRGPLALLFLNNNYHAVHHAKPGLAWYRLPGEFARQREMWLARNGGYAYRSYGEVFRRYLLRRKDPVAHPIWTPPRDAARS